MMDAIFTGRAFISILLLQTDYGCLRSSQPGGPPAQQIIPEIDHRLEILAEPSG
ncbi:MAG: hypothetical protein Q7O12_02470 [Deltaproteobacteria bacterium]|nr:hypothetical protein [Deltaproteobacteria bacterium]